VRESRQGKVSFWYVREDTGREFQVCSFLGFSPVMRRWDKKERERERRKERTGEKFERKRSSLNP
jgi:hypothetical protein